MHGVSQQACALGVSYILDGKYVFDAFFNCIRTAVVL
jgi:hypothetical protein